MTNNYIIQISLLIIILACVLFFSLYKSNKNILFLSSFLIIYAIQSVTEGLVFYGGPVWLLAILFIHFNPLYYLAPALFYFSVRASLTDSMHLSKRDLLHLIPFLVILVAAIPYYFTGFSYKLELASGLMGNYDAYLDYGKLVVFNEHFNQFVRPVIFLGYMVASVVQAHRFLPKYRSAYGPVLKQYRFQLRSIYLAIVVFSIHAIVQLIVSIDYLFEPVLIQGLDHISFLLHVSGIMYLCIPFYIITQPRFLYGMPQLDNSLHTANDDSHRLTDGNGHHSDKQPKENHFSENENLIRLSEQIMAYLHAEKPYLNEKFSVLDICERLSVPRHHVQYCFNIIMNKSFSEMKNELRIQHAMELMKINSKNNLSIEGIGRQSGFASNSSFYTSFKEETGLTPSKWMELHAAASTETVTRQS
ncbi:MAG: AraC family transcriptional regulator [Bacteroidia bacterium]|nr:AraC family transcriptional regulator [Bacteroidia bacterium]